MAQLNVPAAPALKTSRYSELRGVDFSQDPSLINKKRSPMAINLISDAGGNPVKRTGWRKLHDVESPVHNIWFGEINGEEKIIVHAGSKIYEMTDTACTEIHTVGNEKGTGFFMRKDDKGYHFGLLREVIIITNDGENVGLVKDIAKRPKILISRNPDGGGVSFEEVNLLTGGKTVSFLGDEQCQSL